MSAFFFFFDMSTQEGRWGIRTSNLRFMRRGSSRLNNFLETVSAFKTFENPMSKKIKTFENPIFKIKLVTLQNDVF
jgi:hypothetical protein